MTLSKDPSPTRDSRPTIPSLNRVDRFCNGPVLGARRSPILLPETGLTIQPQMALSSYTSYRVGGAAEWLAVPRTLSQLQDAVTWATTQGEPITLLGAGSNLLVSDRGLPGLVICTRHFRSTQFDAETGRITAAAGEPLPRLAWQAAERGWQGLEWAVGIPGTAGGAVVMNAGAHQSCMADILIEAHILTARGTLEIIRPDQMGYAYRTSQLQGDPTRLVAQAVFQLQPGAEPNTVANITRDHKDHRQKTQPYNLPSCGSVFRNPSPKTAGWLIEQSGLKGYQIGGAQVAQRHANFILNCGNASAGDIFRLMHHVQEQVEQQWNLLLHPEVKILGDFQVS
ncbi:MAG: UDP-N-acetylmuramate dehydrogenase [Kaiparowitsia implicata GSE-PSE-MK54-09C]|nr:UDP-N-acetylmuramate dehydrogenase [Kaiparowitsia implicata GSE-PSE-MK54-09C]